VYECEQWRIWAVKSVHTIGIHVVLGGTNKIYECGLLRKGVKAVRATGIRYVGWK
jgi:hypothetical protein